MCKSKTSWPSYFTLLAILIEGSTGIYVSLYGSNREPWKTQKICMRPRALRTPPIHGD
jgi:hypothetical protein